MTQLPCSGWWDQTGLGRQEMRHLVLSIAGQQITGSGTDAVADFTFAGRIREDGRVELIKQYLERHAVLYVGQFDGEGALFGTWDIDGYRGKWAIKFLKPSSTSATIQEIRPLGP